MSESYNYLQSADPRYEVLAPHTLREHDDWQSEASHIADRIPFEGLRSAVQNWAILARENSVSVLTTSTEAVTERLQQAAQEASYKSASAAQLKDEDMRRGSIKIKDIQVGMRPNYRSYSSFSQEVEQKASANNRPSPEDVRCAYDQIVDEGFASFRMNLMYYYGQWQEVAETASADKIAKRVSGVQIDKHGQYVRQKLKTLVPYAEAEWRISGDSVLLYKLGRIASFGLAYREETNRKKNLQSAIEKLSEQPEYPFDVNQKALIERELQDQKITPKEERGTVARLYYQTTEQINIRLAAAIDALTRDPDASTPASVREHAEQLVAKGMTPKAVMRKLSFELHPDLNKDVDGELYGAVAQWYAEKTTPKPPQDGTAASK